MRHKQCTPLSSSPRPLHHRGVPALHGVPACDDPVPAQGGEDLSQLRVEAKREPLPTRTALEGSSLRRSTSIIPVSGSRTSRLWGGAPSVRAAPPAAKEGIASENRSSWGDAIYAQRGKVWSETRRDKIERGNED